MSLFLFTGACSLPACPLARGAEAGALVRQAIAIAPSWDIYKYISFLLPCCPRHPSHRSPGDREGMEVPEVPTEDENQTRRQGEQARREVNTSHFPTKIGLCLATRTARS